MDKGLCIATLSNITIEPYLAIPITQYFGKNTTVFRVPFEEHTNNEYRNILNKADLIVVWLNLETLMPQFYFEDESKISELITICKNLHTYLKTISCAQIIWLSFEAYTIPRSVTIGHVYCSITESLNRELKADFGNQVSFIDFAYIIAEVGIANAYDIRGKYRWCSIYSAKLVAAVAQEIYKQYLIEQSITKKCLVLDCDNVLWGGILVEDGIEKLKLGTSGQGRAHQDFQRFVLSLWYRGITIALCSKNDINDVLSVFKNHSAMILRTENIACLQVNWDDKPSNIRKIAEELNLSLDSMVFVDDSIVEIEAVNALLPDVTTIHYRPNMDFRQFNCFNLREKVNVTDIKRRNETYRTNNYRRALQSEYAHYDDYLIALQTRVDIHKAAAIEYYRIAEMTQRTNKCTNGKRYTAAEIEYQISHQATQFYSVTVSDRFSNLGLVGAFEIDHNTLTLISLSCRVLGRKIEEQVIDYIVRNYNIEVIEFKPTPQNSALRSFLLDAFPRATFQNFRS